MEINYETGDAKINLVMADDSNIEEVMDALTKIVKKKVQEENTDSPEVLME